MANVRYKSGDIAKMLGITPETIRYYEKNGIVLSSREKGNGYRKFHFYEVASMQRIRLHQNFGFSLKQSFALTDNCALDDICGELKQNQSNIEKQIRWQKRLYEYSFELQKYMAEIPQMLNHFRIEDCPALYHLKYQQDRKMVKNKILDDTIKMWYHECPLVFTGAVTSYDVVKPWFQGEIGFSVYEKDYDEFIGEPNSLTQYVPSRPSVYTIIAINREVENFYPPFIPLVEYVNQQHLTPDGQIFCLPIALNCRLKKADKPRDFYQVWLPLKNI